VVLATLFRIEACRWYFDEGWLFKHQVAVFYAGSKQIVIKTESLYANSVSETSDSVMEAFWRASKRWGSSSSNDLE
jgi:hypothetical protein